MSPNALLVAAASSSSSSTSANNATSVIIGVTISVTSVALLVVAFRIWRCTRPPKTPFPPKGPLAHDRQRQIASEFSQPELQPHEFTPLAQPAPYSSHSRQASSRTDVASIPPSSPSIVSSQVHLVSESDENTEINRGRRPSLANPPGPRRHLHGYRSRTVSNTGSVRSTRSRQPSQGTIRGPPHLHHVNIVLPQPLAPGLYSNNNFRQPLMHYARAYPGKRRAESCDREYRFGRVSMDDSSSSTHDSALYTTLHRGSAENTPLPPLPNGSPTSPSTPRPRLSSTPAPDISSPNASMPLLTETCPSPDYGPPPLPPPKDPQLRYSSRRRRHSESASGRQRP